MNRKFTRSIYWSVTPRYRQYRHIRIDIHNYAFRKVFQKYNKFYDFCQHVGHFSRSRMTKNARDCPASFEAASPPCPFRHSAKRAERYAKIRLHGCACRHAGSTIASVRRRVRLRIAFPVRKREEAEALPLSSGGIRGQSFLLLAARSFLIRRDSLPNCNAGNRSAIRAYGGMQLLA